MLDMSADTRADREVIRLLHKVDKLRADLRILEPQLAKACNEYGKRRGMLFFFDDHLRNLIEQEAVA